MASSWWSMVQAVVQVVSTALITILLVTFTAVLPLVRHSKKKQRRIQIEEMVKQLRTKNKETSGINDGKARVVGFFHPNCTAGGGGERVLWMCISSLFAMKDEQLLLVIYTIDKQAQAEEAAYKKYVQDHVSSRFGISLSEENLQLLRFVFLQKPSQHNGPSSLIAQSLASMKLAHQALSKCTPHVYVDTTGCAFTFFLAKLLHGCKILAYVHYPTISTDMLHMVWERRPSYNHSPHISTSTLMTYIKLAYYLAFAFLYGCAGSLADLVFVNSTWTRNHIHKLWFAQSEKTLHVLYPPVDVHHLKTLPLTNKQNVILSIGQFRPEKDHALQLRAFAKLLKESQFLKTTPTANLTMVLAGSCRDADDENRVKQLKTLAQELHLTIQDDTSNTPTNSKNQHMVQFVLNQPYSTIQNLLSQSSVGIHTMWNEHFGIGIVEMMAAGLLVVAHDSGGPRADIVTTLAHVKDKSQNQDQKQQKVTGFLASSEEQYAAALDRALQLGYGENEEGMEMRRAARESSERFSNEVFVRRFTDAVLSARILT